MHVPTCAYDTQGNETGTIPATEAIGVMCQVQSNWVLKYEPKTTDKFEKTT